jgi:hypothetical protein
LNSSLDHLIGAGKDRWRDCQAEGLGGLEIDDQLECCRLLDRQIGGLGAVEDLSGINADQARLSEVGRRSRFRRFPSAAP